MFAGSTPQNVVLNGDDLDRAIDDARGVLASQAPSADAMRDLLTRFTQATSIGHFHALLCEATELLRTCGVGEVHRG